MAVMKALMETSEMTSWTNSAICDLRILYVHIMFSICFNVKRLHARR